MAKKNSQVEWLERENKFLREEIKRLRTEPEDLPLTACDNSCVVAKPRGMSTNGGCCCDESRLRHAVTWWRRRAEFLQATLIQIRDGGDSVAQWDAMAPELRRIVEKYGS